MDKEKLHQILSSLWKNDDSVGKAYYNQALQDVQTAIDLQEEPVSDELEKACEQLAENARKHKAETSSPFFSQTDYKQGVIDGAKWQKENLWKPADGEDLKDETNDM